MQQLLLLMKAPEKRLPSSLGLSPGLLVQKEGRGPVSLGTPCPLPRHSLPVRGASTVRTGPSRPARGLVGVGVRRGAPGHFLLLLACGLARRLGVRRAGALLGPPSTTSPPVSRPAVGQGVPPTSHQLYGQVGRRPCAQEEAMAHIYAPAGGGLRHPFSLGLDCPPVECGRGRAFLLGQQASGQSGLAPLGPVHAGGSPCPWACLGGSGVGGPRATEGLSQEPLSLRLPGASVGGRMGGHWGPGWRLIH